MKFEDKCGFKVSWNEVDNGGSDILGFFIRIDAPGAPADSADYEGNVNTANCGYDVLEERMCFIKCTDLKNIYGLEINDPVKAQVMATNTVGASNWSSQGDSSPAVVTLPPVAMAMPKSISTSGDTITITWAELVGADTNG